MSRLERRDSAADPRIGLLAVPHVADAIRAAAGVEAPPPALEPEAAILAGAIAARLTARWSRRVSAAQRVGVVAAEAAVMLHAPRWSAAATTAGHAERVHRHIAAWGAREAHAAALGCSADAPAAPADEHFDGVAVEVGAAPEPEHVTVRGSIARLVAEAGVWERAGARRIDGLNVLLPPVLPLYAAARSARVGLARALAVAAATTGRPDSVSDDSWSRELFQRLVAPAMRRCSPPAAGAHNTVSAMGMACLLSLAPRAPITAATSGALPQSDRIGSTANDANAYVASLAEFIAASFGMTSVDAAIDAALVSDRCLDIDPAAAPRARGINGARRAADAVWLAELLPDAGLYAFINSTGRGITEWLTLVFLVELGRDATGVGVPQAATMGGAAPRANFAPHTVVSGGALCLPRPVRKATLDTSSSEDSDGVVLCRGPNDGLPVAARAFVQRAAVMWRRVALRREGGLHGLEQRHEMPGPVARGIAATLRRLRPVASAAAARRLCGGAGQLRAAAWGAMEAGNADRGGGWSEWSNPGRPNPRAVSTDAQRNFELATFAGTAVASTLTTHAALATCAASRNLLMPNTPGALGLRHSSGLGDVASTARAAIEAASIAERVQLPRLRKLISLLRTRIARGATSQRQRRTARHAAEGQLRHTIAACAPPLATRVPDPAAGAAAAAAAGARKQRRLMGEGAGAVVEGQPTPLTGVSRLSAAGCCDGPYVSVDEAAAMSESELASIAAAIEARAAAIEVELAAAQAAAAAEPAQAAREVAAAVEGRRAELARQEAELEAELLELQAAARERAARRIAADGSAVHAAERHARHQWRVGGALHDPVLKSALGNLAAGSDSSVGDEEVTLAPRHGVGGISSSSSQECCGWCARAERRLRRAMAEAEHSLLGLPARSWGPSSARTALDVRCPAPPPGAIWGHALCIDVIDAGCGPTPGATLAALLDGAERAEHTAPLGMTLPPRPDGATVGALPGAPCLFAVSTAVPLSDSALPFPPVPPTGSNTPHSAAPGVTRLVATGRTTRAGAVVGATVAVSRSTRIPLADDEGRRSGTFLHLDFEAL